MDIRNVIIKPYLTEKTFTVKDASEKQVVTFVVDRRANKHQIANAFFAIYNIEAEKINTLNKKPARIRTGTLKPGYSKAMKIAYITLPLGQKIAITKEETEQAVEEAQVVEPKETTKAKSVETKKEAAEKPATKTTKAKSTDKE